MKFFSQLVNCHLIGHPLSLLNFDIFIPKDFHQCVILLEDEMSMGTDKWETIIIKRKVWALYEKMRGVVLMIWHLLEIELKEKASGVFSKIQFMWKHFRIVVEKIRKMICTVTSQRQAVNTWCVQKDLNKSNLGSFNAAILLPWLSVFIL